MMEGWGRRQFLRGTLGLLAAGRVCPGGQGRDKAGPSSLMQRSWRLDPSCVLPRGPKDSYDANVAGDPCIVWDDQRQTWRMFYSARRRFSSMPSAAAGTA
jgi:hypothetical protein